MAVSDSLCLRRGSPAVPGQPTVSAGEQAAAVQHAWLLPEG